MSRKKLLIIGFIIIILIAIPITIFLIKQQQDLRSRAEKATTLSLEPASTAQTPLQKNIDDTINLDIMVDPGTNQNLVSFVKLEILYDPSKLATGGATPQEKPFAEESTVMELLEGPAFTDGKILATLSVGVDPTKVIQTKTKIATLTFTALDGTGSTPTQISFGPETQVLSAGVNDQANENVLAGTQNAFIAIAGEPTIPTVTPTTAQTGTTGTPTPTSVAETTGTPTPTISTTPGTTTGTPTPTTSGTGSTNSAPVCSALSVDRSTTGTAPFSITFTANGTDSDGTITKVTFSFGDGQVDNVTQGGGIGTSTVNAGVSHTYQNAGSYTASAVITDNNGGVSSGTCTQTITVNTAVAGGGSSGGTSTAEPTTIATLPDTGPGDTILAIGGIIGVLTAIGAVLFFAL